MSHSRYYFFDCTLTPPALFTPVRSGFISCAFNAHWDAGVPLKYLLVLLDQLHKSIPLMKRIWEFSADASSGRDTALQQAMETRQGWLDDINSGRISQEELEGLIVQRVVR